MVVCRTLVWGEAGSFRLLVLAVLESFRQREMGHWRCVRLWNGEDRKAQLAGSEGTVVWEEVKKSQIGIKQRYLARC
jgi:hypothetical protein